ncbi:THO complex subunit 1 [Cladobotryum mycophilum]|uniref:THO complex subunit 1 n=1 Tax=Cladobotryum mycophilum TaxID=491253 RepID=A0ABR0SA60_9HYPO
MPALDVENPGVSAVSTFENLLKELLNEASAAKQQTAIEPALNKSDFNKLYDRVSSSFSQPDASGSEGDALPAEAVKARQFAIVETAARDLFDKLIATTQIESAEFVKMWNLLDVLSILSDDGLCDPALLFWLVEELLDSQTISGCRKIFDFLESRRERITAKHFKQKNLVILRSCNELLRRLSRAEDTAFCGRVFIFMFQSFPLGDRSSVNLRGEYHVENVTTYELPSAEDGSNMEVDSQPDAPKDSEAKASLKGVSFSSSQKPLDPDTLYPLFWSLQENFSQPLKLFDPENFGKFRSNLEDTIKAFQALHDDASQTSRSMETLRRTLKRKRDEDPTEAQPEAFNPKYLTSKDLFQLEISDLSFRRHVLVQALIITDFLLSLSAGERGKRTNINVSNKSVVYSDQLSEDNTKWANDMKRSISDYLKQGFDGPYFYRMVETVLARDKNWVFWKMASCPPIQRNPVSPASFNEAKEAAQRMATNKRLRSAPMGAMSLDFLRNGDEGSALEELKSAERYQLPELESFKRKIADDDFEIEMPTSGETKVAAVAGKASKSWRALRIASRFKLASFDKIDDPKKIDIVFEDAVEGDDEEEDTEPAASEENMPKNRDPIVISGPSGVGKSALVEKLMERHKGVFAPVVRHTIREPEEGEVNGKTFYFVKAPEFNQLRDGDRLIEYGTRDGAEYGTSTKAIDAITEAGKVPIIELDLEAAQFAKDMDFSARYLLIKPPTNEALHHRLSQAGNRDEAAIQALLASLPQDLDESKTRDLFDTVITNDDLDKTVDSLRDYIYDDGGDGKTAGEEVNGDASMTDAPGNSADANAE